MKKIEYMFILIASYLFMIQFIGCSENSGLCKDDELSNLKQNYTSSELRIDGYYYGEPYSDNEVRILFFYRNGVFFDSNSEPLENAKNGTITIDIQNSFAKQVKALWGNFMILGSTIQVERWRAVSVGCFKTLYEKGEIKNDTTFVITQREYRNNGKVEKTETTNITFYFRQLPQKPDSTNNFIK